jgi:hypothetical protein
MAVLPAQEIIGGLQRGGHEASATGKCMAFLQQARKRGQADDDVESWFVDVSLRRTAGRERGKLVAGRLFSLLQGRSLLMLKFGCRVPRRNIQVLKGAPDSADGV